VGALGRAGEHAPEVPAHKVRLNFLSVPSPPSPAPPDVSPHTARGWGGMAVLWQRLPSAPCCCSFAASLAVAASCTPPRVCTSLSLVLAVPSCATSPALIALNQSPLAAPPRRPQAPGPGDAGLRLAGSLQRWSAAGAGRLGAHALPGRAAWGVQTRAVEKTV
jgi:hypothetical protein